MDSNTVAIGIGIAVGFAGLGVGIGQGIAVNGALNGVSRQPEAAGRINNMMLLGLVFMELVFLLAFVLGFLLKSNVPAATAGGASAMNTVQSRPVAQNSVSPIAHLINN